MVTLYGSICHPHLLYVIVCLLVLCFGSLVPRRSRPLRRTSGRLTYISCHRGVASVGVIEALIALRMQFIREI